METVKVKTPTGHEFELKKPGGLSAAYLAGGLPVLVAAKEGKLKTEAEAQRVTESVARYREVVFHCVVSPKIVDKWPEDCADGEVSSEDLDPEHDIGFLTGEIMKLAGYTKEAEEELAPSSGTATE